MHLLQVCSILLLVHAAAALPGRYKRQNSIIIDVGAIALGLGAGGVDDAHQAAVVVQGSPSYSNPLGLDLGIAGLSDINNAAAIIQVTNDNGEGQLGGFQAAGGDQNADSSDILIGDANGEVIDLDSSSQANVEAAGVSVSNADIVILIN